MIFLIAPIFYLFSLKSHPHSHTLTAIVYFDNLILPPLTVLDISSYIIGVTMVVDRNNDDIRDLKLIPPWFYINSSVPNDIPSKLEEIPISANKNNNPAVTVSTAGIRAIIYQLQTLYLRTPVKLFRPSRFDYLAYVRAIADKHDGINLKPWKFTTHSSIALLINAVKKEGWKFIPDQVLPPLIANSATGLILYGSYLTSLDLLQNQNLLNSNPTTTAATTSLEANYYSPIVTWKAGFLAGMAQSLAAAPLDAIYTRSSTADMINGKHQNLWVYGLNKLKEIGLAGVFAGYGFSLIKESIGFAFYFSTFETVKNQGYSMTYSVIQGFRRIKKFFRENFAAISHYEIDEELVKFEERRLTKILRSSFVLIAGASAAFALLAVQYPISKVQNLHLSRLEALDIYNSSREVTARRPFVKVYYNSYIDTYHQALRMKRRSKTTWFQLGYKGFVKNALTTIPATSIGLLVFEIMRTRLSSSLENDQFN